MDDGTAGTTGEGTDPRVPSAPWSPVDPGAWDHRPDASWYSAGAGPAVPTRRRRRTGPVVAGIAVLVALLVAAGVAAPRLLPTGSGLRSVVPAAGSGSTATGSPGTSGADAAAARESAIAALLARRGDAVAGDDLAQWRTTQTPTAKAPLFSRLAALPITQWVYDVTSTTPGKNASTVALDVRVHLRLDVDTSDAVVHEHLTLVNGTAGWRVAAEATADRRAQPWDLGALTVVRGTHSLVIGIDTATSVLRGYARLADASVPGVDAVWGTAWSQEPVLVVPHTVAQLGRALARSAASLDGYAAVTTGELTDGGSPSALRIWTNTPGMAELSATGREVVVRHEITHVATNAPGTPGVPLWLEEGFAEYVGYRGSGIALDDELRELIEAQRRGTAPRHLPTQAMFDGEEVDLAYESADLACRLVVEEYGQKALVRLYRLTVAGTGSAAQNLDAALRQVTGAGTAAFETAWRARMRTLAA